MGDRVEAERRDSFSDVDLLYISTSNFTFSFLIFQFFNSRIVRLLELCNLCTWGWGVVLNVNRVSGTLCAFSDSGVSGFAN